MIPKPYYQDEHVTLYCGDCREILPELGTFDLLLTDPPYGLGNRLQGGTWGGSEKYDVMRTWDQETPSQETMDAVRCAGQSAIIWGGNYFALPPARCVLIWDKSNAVPTMASAELAWTSLDIPVRTFRGQVGKHNSGHATEKPVALFCFCLGFVPDAKTILDPFAGSCTTGVAAKLEGRHATLIEISERYCEIGAERLRQGVLF